MYSPGRVVSRPLSPVGSRSASRPASPVNSRPLSPVGSCGPSRPQSPTSTSPLIRALSSSSNTTGTGFLGIPTGGSLLPPPSADGTWSIDQLSPRPRSWSISSRDPPPSRPRSASQRNVRESVVTFQSKGKESDDSDDESDSGSDGDESASRKQPRLNEYIIQHTIGKGAYGVVKCVQDMNDKKLYAMKMINCKELNKRHRFSRSSNTPQSKLMREIAIMKKLDHPNVISLYQVIDDPKAQMMYLVMELVDGGPPVNSDGQERCTPLDQELCRKYFRDALLGLQYIHDQGIVHNDVKPDNMLVTSEGVLKIADYGVSHLFENDDDVIQRTEGTLAFHAPEMCSGQPYRGRPVDVWALGVSLYWMAFGRLPFWGDNPVALYEAIRGQALWFPDDCDPNLENCLRHTLQKDPLRRITLSELTLHPWVTKDNSDPLFDESDRPKIVITDEDIARSIASIDSVVLLAKIKFKMTRLVSSLRKRMLVATTSVQSQSSTSLTSMDSSTTSSTSISRSDSFASRVTPATPVSAVQPMPLLEVGTFGSVFSMDVTPPQLTDGDDV